MQCKASYILTLNLKKKKIKRVEKNKFNQKGNNQND